jgi:hypothetical protein
MYGLARVRLVLLRVATAMAGDDESTVAAVMVTPAIDAARVLVERSAAWEASELEKPLTTVMLHAAFAATAAVAVYVSVAVLELLFALVTVNAPSPQSLE